MECVRDSGEKAVRNFSGTSGEWQHGRLDIHSVSPLDMLSLMYNIVLGISSKRSSVSMIVARIVGVVPKIAFSREAKLGSL